MRGVTRGTTNVFADLGFADAEERQTKLRLAHAINTILEKRHLVQADAANNLGVNPPKVSALIQYKLEGFSVEILMRVRSSSRSSSGEATNIKAGDVVEDQHIAFGEYLLRRSSPAK